MAIFVTFVVVAVIYLAKMDYDAQTICNDAVQEFVDKSRASGYISADSYMLMMDRINGTGNLYNVTILHQSRNTSPLVDDDGNVVDNSFIYSYTPYNKDDILSYMFTSSGTTQNWSLKNGDYLKISYSLKNPTFASKMYSFWTTHEYKTIHGSYGGYVGSREENGIK